LYQMSNFNMARTLAIMTEIFQGFPQSFQPNKYVNQVILLPSKSFTIHHPTNQCYIIWQTDSIFKINK
jgi:hypothetical protein